MDLEQGVTAVSKIRDVLSNQPAVTLVIILLLLFIIMQTALQIGEALGKFFGAVKSCLIHFIGMARGGAEYRENLGRRRQFLAVLSSDLASIGKAEAWNDQNFTDLEAEVQIEGGYYASLIDRFRRRRSHSERKEESLIGAIDGSIERCLLLTGDPGAGKSVALRHLASQMVERARKSRAKYVPIPLYVNLRELDRDGVVDKDAIKRFVIDNVRRGDADTADYVQQNWDSFNRNGGWFFLFDSFDEIPEVIHSSNEDVSIEKYGRAIQHFMDGLGACRGVLASREFKSPKALPWPRIRILPLSERLQEELVGNTFLKKNQKALALSAITTSSTSTYRNPLFLTLLCRFIRENNSSPKNEHDLLYRQVESLASRDSEYVQSRWGLRPGELLSAATDLARLFALSPDIGLAPTIEEIVASAARLDLMGGRIESSIEALTYVKIGRMDVASTNRNERRFAFSHRRYHEAIFARYLSGNFSKFDVNDLLVNARWREYVVAMLQANPAEDNISIIVSAAKILERRVSVIKLSSDKAAGEIFRYYLWDDPSITHILKIMVDVKKYNPSPCWEVAEEQVDRFFSPLWRKGDLHDRLMIIKYGGAGSSASHSRRLDFARNSGIECLQQAAVSSCQFATSPSEHLADWMRNRVSTRILYSRKRLEILKWESLAAQLPASYEMEACLRRAKSLRKFIIGAQFWMFPLMLLRRVRLLESILVNFDRVVERQASFVVASNLMPFFMVTGALLSAYESSVPSVVINSLFGVSLALLLNSIFVYIAISNISLPRRIAWTDVVSTFRSRKVQPVAVAVFSIIAAIVAAVPGGIALFLVNKYEIFADMGRWDIFVLGSAIGMLLFGATGSILNWRSQRSITSSTLAILRARKSLRSALVEAKGFRQIFEMCRLSVSGGGVPGVELRRAIVYLSALIIRNGDEKNNGGNSMLTSAASALLEDYSSRDTG